MSKKNPGRDLPEPVPSSTYTGLNRQKGESVGDYRDRMNARIPVFNGTSWTHEIRPGETPEEYQARTQMFTCPEGMQLVDTGLGMVDASQVGEPSEDSDLHATIKEWWLEQSQLDVQLVLRKHDEYGDDSLATGGFALARLMGRKVTRGRAQEIAIWHDLGVKLARLENALRKGEDVGDDTWQDIACYAMMGRKAQLHGGWPFDPDAEEV